MPVLVFFSGTSWVFAIVARVHAHKLHLWLPLRQPDEVKRVQLRTSAVLNVDGFA